MHRGALWASGAAQAAQFVRIILRWRGVCRAFASRGVFFVLKLIGFFKMPRGSATTAPPRDYGSGFSSTYSAFGGGGLGLFASAPGFITTTPRVVDDTSSAPGAPGDTTRRSSP